jgi:uncharacterized small protein (DUF1192 family)
MKRQSKFVITNSVPSVDEMGRRLGMSKRRIERVKKIMAAKPSQRKVQ